MLNRITPVTRNLLIANVIVFVLQWIIGPELNFYFTDWAALNSVQSGRFRVWQLITMMFLHGNFLHIAFNMFALITFGPFLETFWGAKRYFQFYMICGIIASLAQLAVAVGDSQAIGASGAVMGVLAAFAYLYPNTELLLLFIPIPIKAKYLIPGLILIDLVSGVANFQDGIAHFAHLGGALAGLVLVYFWRGPSRRRY